MVIGSIHHLDTVKEGGRATTTTPRRGRRGCIVAVPRPSAQDQEEALVPARVRFTVAWHRVPIRALPLRDPGATNKSNSGRRGGCIDGTSGLFSEANTLANYVPIALRYNALSLLVETAGTISICGATTGTILIGRQIN